MLQYHGKSLLIALLGKKHMNPKQIGESYDKIADRWNSDKFNRANGIEQHKRAIAFVKEKNNALDIGCGSSGRFIDLLTHFGFHVEGVDISERMIKLARQRHPNITFYQEDICLWDLPRHYDFITAWDSTWHLPFEEQEPVLKKICDGLTRGGIFIFTTGAVDAPTVSRDCNMGPPVFYSLLGIPKTLEVLTKWGCVCRHLEYDQYPEGHLYIIAQKT